ncbi:MAG: hypothetical protein EA400_16595 [Chromatiaceae bacterium]|nr:MAG: hypothetical protein EA400_16595 [Chromatiaceae bacterium]
MTSPIYIRARDPDNGARVLDELLTLGVPRNRLEVYGRQIPAGLRVRARRWRNAAATLQGAAALGAITLPLLGILIMRGMAPVSGLLLALLGAVVGVLSAQAFLHRTQAALGPQQESLRRGDLMIVANLDRSEMQRVEAHITKHHPEILLLGRDPAGSPPFP